jgi:hypothetical protein
MGNDAKTPHSMVRLGKKKRNLSYIFLRFYFYLENYHQMQRKLNKNYRFISYRINFIE